MLVFFMAGCNPTDRTTQQPSDAGDDYPDELVDFAPYEKNPVFTGTGADTWDQKIRERGFILKEDDGYHMWYTGFRDNPDQEMMALGMRRARMASAGNAIPETPFSPKAGLKT